MAKMENRCNVRNGPEFDPQQGGQVPTQDHEEFGQPMTFAVIPIQKPNNDWKTRRANHTSPVTGWMMRTGVDEANGPLVSPGPYFALEPAGTYGYRDII